MLKKSVVVLAGGIAGEREVSLSSGAGVAEALHSAGYSVRIVDVTNDVPALLHALLNPRPDVVFNALHGPWGEDGCINGLLEWLHLPYTHSGVMSSALAMNKPMSLRIFKEVGLQCAPGQVVLWAEAKIPEKIFPYPYVVKPIDEGSSLGVYIVHDASSLPPAKAFADSTPLLVEKYIPGQEIQVTVLGDAAKNDVKAWGAIEIRPKQGFYDYRAKYTQGYADHVMPADIPAAAYARALRIAEQAHIALSCRGVSRVDLRYDSSKVTSENPVGDFYILELNTQPGMTPLSLVPETMAYYGWSYQDVVSWLVESARLDLPLDKSVTIASEKLACGM